MAPMVSVLEVVLPLIMPKKALAKILILAAPPRVWPNRDWASLKKKAPPPVLCNTIPNTMKPISRVQTTSKGIPRMPLVPMAYRRAVVKRS